MKFRLPKSVSNILTISGILLTILGFIVFGIMFLLAEINLIPHGPYIGIILYIVMPIPILTGLILIPLGMYLNRMRMLTKLNDFNNEIIDEIDIGTGVETDKVNEIITIKKEDVKPIISKKSWWKSFIDWFLG